MKMTYKTSYFFRVNIQPLSFLKFLDQFKTKFSEEYEGGQTAFASQSQAALSHLQSQTFSKLTRHVYSNPVILLMFEENVNELL